MGRTALGRLGASLLMLAACGGSQNPPDPGGSSGSGETITGRERLGWTQTAPTPGELSAYGYALYVNGQRRVLVRQTCSVSGTTAECSAPLPQLEAGRHTLELAAFLLSGDTVIEGPRSPALNVTVQGVTAPADGQIVQGGSFESSDGLALHADILARNLHDPVDLAVAQDGRVFVAERGGRLRIFGKEAIKDASEGDGHLLADLGETTAGTGAALLSVALAPDFSSSGLLHVAYSTARDGRPELRVVRFREVRGLFGQPAIVASYPMPAIETAAVLRFAPDGTLHAAIGAASNPREAQDPSRVAGKILRINPDGTTPSDNPGGSPILSAGHRDPRGLAWLPQDRSLWAVERADREDEINRITPGANYGWPAMSARKDPRVIRPAVILDVRSESSGLTVVAAAEHPFFGDLIVSTSGARDLLRLRMGTDDVPRIAGRLLQGRFGRIAGVAAGLDGALYLVTANQDSQGPGQDVLVCVRMRVPTEA